MSDGRGETYQGDRGLFYGRRKCRTHGWSVVDSVKGFDLPHVGDSRKALGVKPKYSYQVYGINYFIFASKWFYRIQTYTCNI